MVALPFLPINEVEAGFDSMKEYIFTGNEADVQELNKFRDYFMDYFDNQWLNGDIRPSVWNFWMKPSGLTNNR